MIKRLPNVTVSIKTSRSGVTEVEIGLRKFVNSLIKDSSDELLDYLMNKILKERARKRDLSHLEQSKRR
jgi:hypothetical protein